MTINSHCPVFSVNTIEPSVILALSSIKIKSSPIKLLTIRNRTSGIVSLTYHSGFILCYFDAHFFRLN